MASRSLGTLTIDLVAKISGFARGMSQAERIASTRMRAMQREAARLGKLMGATLSAGAVAGLYAMIDATIESDRAMAQLQQRLKSTGNAIGLSANQLVAMADRLQAVTTYSDDAIVGAEGLLLAYTRIGKEVFPQALEAALNLSTALGVDLDGAIKTVGKALDAPAEGLSGLTKIGVRFTDAQEAMVESLVASNQTLEAQKLILAELETRYGGSARAARDTLGGAFEALQNAAGNLLEAEGGGLRGVIDAVNDLTDTLNSPETKAGFQTVISGLAAMANWGAKAVAALSGNDEARRQADLANSQKSYLGLLARRLEVEEEIHKLSTGSDFENQMRSRGRQAMGRPGIEALRKEMGEVERLLQQHRKRMGELGGAAGASPALPDFTVMDPMTIHMPRAGGGDSAAKRAAEEAARAIEETRHANERFTAGLQDLRAELAGPLAQAELDHNRRMQELRDLAADGEVGSEELQQALDAETELYRKRVEAIKATKSPLEELLAAQEREIALLGLTGAALDTEAARLGATAEEWTKYGAAVEANFKHLEAAREQIGAMDEFRDSFQGIFEDVLTGSKSGIDAIKDLADAFVAQLARMAAEWASAQLFGAMGTAGGGAAGGWLGALFSLFGGGSSGATNFGIPLPGSGQLPGFANGGRPPVGRAYWVGENGPEIRIDDRPGTIVPAAQSANAAAALGGNKTYHITIPVSGAVDMRTKQQIAQEVRRSVAFAERAE